MKKETVDLLFASSAGDARVVEDILGTNVFSTDTLNNALRVACLDNHIETAKLLIQHGAKVEDYLLTIAAMKGQTNLILFLLANGADVKHKQYLCVRKALELGYTDVVDAMIESKFVD